jgi:septal ring factor EnvC (AmiA/AmiB activator)
MATDTLRLAEALTLIEQLRQENRGFHAIAASLEQQIAAFEKRIADLAAENKALRDELDDAQRQAARQADSHRPGRSVDPRAPGMSRFQPQHHSSQESS